MSLTIELLLFVVTNGFLFATRFRGNPVAVVLVTIVAIGSTYLFLEEVYNRWNAYKTTGDLPVKVGPKIPEPSRGDNAQKADKARPFCVTFNGRQVCE